MINFSIIKKSQLENSTRMDAEFYNPEVVIDFSKGSWSRVGDILDFTQYGTSEDLNEDGLGFPTLRLNEFDEVFIGKPQKNCNKISEKTAGGLYLKKDDVLICRTNGNPKLVGKSALVVKDDNYIFASYLFRIRVKKEILSPASLMIYLNSKIGRSEIDKFSLTSNQTNFSPATLREIRVPIFSKEFQKKNDCTVDEVYNLNEQSKLSYKQAEDLFLEKIGLSNYNLEKSLSIVINLSEAETVNRMDAEFFQGDSEKILKIIKEKTKISKLNEIAKVRRGSAIDPKFYSDSGLPYLRGKDFSSGKINRDSLVCIKNDFKPSNETKVKIGDVVFALIGSVGTLALVEKEFDNSFISNNVGKIEIDDKEQIDPYYFTLLFHSIVGKSQFKKYLMQTAQPKISEEEMNNFQIPILPKETQEKISDLVKKSFEARQKSNELLEEAKRKVEEEIEK